MNAEQFVEACRKELLDANMRSYRRLLENTSVDQATDPYWKELLGFYGELPEPAKELLHQVMRQVAVDTISSVFAVLDGAAMLRGQEEDFHLLCDSERLDGDLQDLFLAGEET